MSQAYTHAVTIHLPKAVLGLGGLLAYISIKTFIHLPPKEEIPAWQKICHFIRADEDSLDVDMPHYRRVRVAVAFNDQDKKVLSHALSLARHHGATLCFFHVVEGTAGVLFGEDAQDAEAREDAECLNKLASSLGHRRSDIETLLGFGDVCKELVRMVRAERIDIRKYALGTTHRPPRTSSIGIVRNAIVEDASFPHDTKDILSQTLEVCS